MLTGSSGKASHPWPAELVVSEMPPLISVTPTSLILRLPLLLSVWIALTAHRLTFTRLKGGRMT